MELTQYGLNSTVFLALAALGLIMCVTVEQAQLLIKHYGARRQMVASGYNSAMKLMVLNRMGTVLYFLFIAIAIDLGTPPYTLARFFIAACIVIAAGDAFILIWMWRKFVLRWHLVLASGLRLVPIVASFVATFFGLLGLTFPMLLSAANPELRLTLANTGFLFNSIFTIINVFLVESYLARLIDAGNQSDVITYFVALVYVVRLLSALVCGVLLCIVANNVIVLSLKDLLP